MTLSLNEYAKAASSFARPPKPLTAEESNLLNWALGLAGEAGELAEKVKKLIFHGHDVSPAEMMKELGDVLWYSANTPAAINAIFGTQLTLEDAAIGNLQKLGARYEHGFTEEASIARVDTIVVDPVPERGESVSWDLGPGHQTDPVAAPKPTPFCAVHDVFPCPEWCESDPVDAAECAA